MKKQITQTVLFGLMLLLLGACNHKTQTSMMRNATGKAGELVVVISPGIWDAAPGKELNAILTQDQVGLPQGEPLFNVTNIPWEGYADIFKTSRNIVEVRVGASAEQKGVQFKRNVYSYTQAIVVISAKTNEELASLINEKADKIIGFFLTAERERLTKNYNQYGDKVVRQAVEDKFGCTINVPPGFVVAENKDNFMWIRFEAPETSQAILIYTYPYESDSTFTSNYLIGKRNVVLKNNVPGPREGSYMTTETELPVTLNSIKLNGNFAAEMRGLWKVQGDYMGGPFVSLSILDLLNNRIITFDGYVYAPSKDKRNFVRQVEAMLYSVKFNNQSDMNKLNRQFDF